MASGSLHGWDFRAIDLGELSHSYLENGAEVQHISEQLKIQVFIQAPGPGINYTALEPVHLQSKDNSSASLLDCGGDKMS